MHWAYFAYVPKLPQKLPLITCPTQVLSGTKDHFCSVAKDVKQLLPRSKLSIIENASVFIGRTMPKEFAEAILSFLRNPAV